MFLDCYKKANFIFEYPLATDMGLDSDKTIKVGLSCRKFNELNVMEIKKRFNKPIVFVSLGRSVEISEELDVSNLSCEFVYTEGIRLKGSNTYKLPADTLDTQDFIKASEVIITKAGWSTVSEAICAKVPMLVLDRQEIKEDATTVEYLTKLGIAKKIDFNEIRNDLDRAIEEVKELGKNFDLLSDRFRNCSKEIAGEILKLLNEGDADGIKQ